MNAHYLLEWRNLWSDVSYSIQVLLSYPSPVQGDDGLYHVTFSNDGKTTEFIDVMRFFAQY